MRRRPVAVWVGGWVWEGGRQRPMWRPDVCAGRRHLPPSVRPQIKQMWPTLFQQPDYVLRYMTMVEIMAPIFQMDMYNRFIGPSLYDAFAGEPGYCQVGTAPAYCPVAG